MNSTAHWIIAAALLVVGPPRSVRAAEGQLSVPAEPSGAVEPAAPTEVPPTPTDDDVDARVDALLAEAAQAFEQRRDTDAWAALDRAEALRADPVYDYMRGLIRQYQGRCDLAVQHWARYLQSEPAAEDAAALQISIDECGGLPETPSDDSEARPSTPPGDPPGTEPEPRPIAPTTPWHRDAWGGALLGTGAVSLAATGGLLIGAAIQRQRGPEQPGLMGHDDRIGSARTLSYVAIATGVTGAALVIGAVIRYVRVARRRPPRETARHRTSIALRWR